MTRITIQNFRTNRAQDANDKYVKHSDAAILAAEVVLKALIADRDRVEGVGATWGDVTELAETAREMGNVADRLTRVGEYAPANDTYTVVNAAGRRVRVTVPPSNND
jgi:hypothetical protein